MIQRPLRVAPTVSIVKCGKCGKPHRTEECGRTTGACFVCGKLGHLVRDCPERERTATAYIQRLPRPIIQGRAYAVTTQDAQASNDVIQGLI